MRADGLQDQRANPNPNPNPNPYPITPTLTLTLTLTLTRTNELIEACRAREQASRNNVLAGREPASGLELAGLDECQQMEPERVFMYCGGDGPWSVADTGSLRLPSAQMIREDARTYGDVARSFDWSGCRASNPQPGPQPEPPNPNPLTLTLTLTLNLTL